MTAAGDPRADLRAKLLQAAETYAGFGWATTWCGESKNPKDSGKGWQKQYHPGHQPPTLAFAPDEGESQGEWEPQTPGSPNQFRPIGRNIAGVGIVCGWQSGGIIVVDIETADIWTKLRALLKDKHAELWAKLATMPRTRTPKGGAHLFVRVAAPSYCWGPRPPAALGKDAAIQWKMTGNAKLAKPADEPEGEEAESAAPKKAKRTDLIELRGRSGFAVLPLTINTPPTVAEAADDDAREEACQPLIGSIESPGERFWVVEPKPVAELDPLSIEEFLELVKACQGFNQSEKLGKERKREVTRIAKAVTQVSRASDGDNLWARANGDSYWHGRMVDALIESGWRIVRELSDGVIEFAHSEASHEVSARFGRLRAPDGNPLFFAHTGPLPVGTSLGATQVIMHIRHHGDGKAMFGEMRDRYLRLATVDRHKASAQAAKSAGRKQEPSPDTEPPAGESIDDWTPADGDKPEPEAGEHADHDGAHDEANDSWKTYNREDPDNKGHSMLGVPFVHGNDGRRLIQLKNLGNARKNCEANAAILRMEERYYSHQGAVSAVNANGGRVSVDLAVTPQAIKAFAERHIQPVRLVVPKGKDAGPAYWAEAGFGLDVATSLANAHEYWPKIVQITNLPRLTPDNKVVVKAGFDHETGIYSSADHPGVDPNPAADPEAAERLNSKITKLVGPWDWTNPNAGPAWSLALLATIVLRHRVKAKISPLWWLTAESSEVGKTQLINHIHILATGRPAFSMEFADNPRENQIRLAGRLAVGDDFISYDNLPNDTVLANSMLDMISTAADAGFRIPHTHREISPGPDGIVVAANGNRISSTSDTANRLMTCHLGKQSLKERLPENVNLTSIFLHARPSILNDLFSAWLQFEAEQMPRMCSQRHRAYEWNHIANFAAWVTGHDLLENRAENLIAQDGKIVAAGVLADAMLPLQVDIVHPAGKNGGKIPNGWWTAGHLTRYAKAPDSRADKEDETVKDIATHKRFTLIEALGKVGSALPRLKAGARSDRGEATVLGMWLKEVRAMTQDAGFVTPNGRRVRLDSATVPSGGAGKMWQFAVIGKHDESRGSGEHTKSSFNPSTPQGDSFNPGCKDASPESESTYDPSFNPYNLTQDNNIGSENSGTKHAAHDTHENTHSHSRINKVADRVDRVERSAASPSLETACALSTRVESKLLDVEGLNATSQPPPHPPSPSPPASQKPASGFPGNVIAAILEAVGGERTLPAARVDFIKSKAGTAKDFDKACLDVCTQHDLGNGVIVLRPKGEVA